MTPTRLILDDLINRLRASDRADEQALLDLQLNHHLTPGQARSVLARARFLLEREARHSGKLRRRYRKAMPAACLKMSSDSWRTSGPVDAPTSPKAHDVLW
jgi:hypothetical protein